MGFKNADDIMNITFKDLITITTSSLIFFSIFVTSISFIVNFDTGDIISGLLVALLIGVSCLKIILPIKLVLWTTFMIIFPSYNFIEVMLTLLIAE